MKYLTIAAALFCSTYAFSQVQEKSESKVIKNEASKTDEKKLDKKSSMKASKIDRPVIDKFTKPREVSEPKKENK